MFPWCLNWSPEVHFPFSGSVQQQIEPEFDWFFGRINPALGDERIERRVFEEAGSYGKQLGLIAEVVLEMAESQQDAGNGASRSLERLKELVAQVETIKTQERGSRRKRLKESLNAYREQEPEDFEQMIEELRGR